MLRKFLLSLLFIPAFVFAEVPFVLKDIQIDGLERVSAGKVFNAIGFEVGDTITQEKVSLATRELFRTGLFNNVEIGYEGDVLVVKVLERPSISKISLEGNEQIDSEEMLKGLRQGGMAEGDVFRKSTLEAVERELKRMYVSQGRYNVNVETEVVPAPRNRVELNIKIQEGEVAKIKQIRIVGNQTFESDDLEDLFLLKPSHWLSWYYSDDLYSSEKLKGDLERVTSYYLDRGFYNFKIASSNVSISPDKESVYITVVVDEGELYYIDQVEVRGEIPEGLTEKELCYLVLFIPYEEIDGIESCSPYPLKDKQLYSQKAIQDSIYFMTEVLGSLGYIFAEVRDVQTEIDESENTVGVSFYIKPRQKVYAQRVNIEGNVQTDEEVLRRELRQAEGGLASNAIIQLSQTRLERLGFFKGVNVETPRVPGTSDLIDLDIGVEEQPSGSISASLGFSQSSGLILGAELQQKNFLGTGNSVTLTAQHSDSTNSYRFGVTDPYFTLDGVSAGFDLFWRTTDYDEENISSYNADVFGGSFTLGYPISETMRVTYGLGYDNTNIKIGRYPAVEYLDFLVQNNSSIDDLYDAYTSGDTYNNFDLRLSFGDSVLNRGLFPTKGYSYSVSSEISIPGASDLNYYKIRFQGQKFFPFIGDWVVRTSTFLGYGDGFGNTDTLPFYESFYSGQYVRGYESNSLGPKETPHWTLGGISPDPIGGNLITTGKLELIFPFPFVEDNRSIRSAFFVDAGQVFNTNCKSQERFSVINPPNYPAFFPWFNYNEDSCLEPDVGEIRASLGIGFTWVTAIAPISFSFAKPLNDEEDDEVEVFQFNLGQTF